MTRHARVMGHISNLVKRMEQSRGDAWAAIQAAGLLLPGELSLIPPASHWPLIDAIAARADFVHGGLVWKTGMEDVGPRLIILASQQPSVRSDVFDRVRRELDTPSPWMYESGESWPLSASQVRVAMLLTSVALIARYPGRFARSAVGVMRDTSGFGLDTFPARPTTELEVRWSCDGVELAVCYRDPDGTVAVTDRHFAALELRFTPPVVSRLRPESDARAYRLPPEPKQSLLLQAAAAGLSFD